MHAIQKSSKNASPGVFLEWPGCGESESIEPYEWNEFFKKILKLNPFTFSEPFALVGHSAGGLGVLSMAAKLKNASHLYLVNPVSPINLRLSKEIRDRYQAMAQSRELVAKTIRSTIHRDLGSSGELLEEMAWRGIQKLGPKLVLSLADFVFDPELSRRKIKIFWGEKDSVLGERHLADIQRLCPSAEVKRQSNLGHSPLLEDPELLSEDLLEFLARD